MYAINLPIHKIINIYLLVFSCRKKHSKHSKLYLAQRLGNNLNCLSPAKNPNKITKSVNPEYCKIQTQSEKSCIMFNWL